MKLLLLLTLSTALFASNYDVLTEKFNKAGLFSFHTCYGPTPCVRNFEGTCYAKEDPNNGMFMKLSLMVMYQDNGPMFPSSYKNYFGIIWYGEPYTGEALVQDNAYYTYVQNEYEQPFSMQLRRDNFYYYYVLGSNGLACYFYKPTWNPYDPWNDPYYPQY